MFQFPAFALLTLYIQVKSTCLAHYRPSLRCLTDCIANACIGLNKSLSGGFPHSDIPGSKGALASPGLIAECHVLHRLLLPRHPPNALIALDPIQKKTGPFASTAGSKPSNPSQSSGYGSLRPDGAPSAGSATVAKSERPCSPEPDRPHGQCVLRLGKTVFGCPAASSARGPASPSRQRCTSSAPHSERTQKRLVFLLSSRCQSLLSHLRDQTGRIIHEAWSCQSDRSPWPAASRLEALAGTGGSGRS